MALFCFFDQRSLGNKQQSAVVSRLFFVSWKTNLVQTCCLSIIVKSAASPLKIWKDSSYIILRFIDFAKFVIIAVKIVKNSSIILAKIIVKWKFMSVMFSVSWRGFWPHKSYTYGRFKRLDINKFPKEKTPELSIFLLSIVKNHFQSCLIRIFEFSCCDFFGEVCKIAIRDHSKNYVDKMRWGGG